VRVIAGSARGRRLKPPARGARATSDLVRGAIFDALVAQGADLSRVLDLYAGSGALGIEALSRGAAWCDFVEREAASVAVIEQNLAATGLAGRAKVHRLAAERAAGRLEGPYTLVLADPPYDEPGAVTALDSLVASGLVDPTATTFVFELSARSEAPPSLGPLPLAWQRRYGDSQVAVYRSEAP
jgi:16S rRNA (guanine966-N2)-methyltransferase